MTIACGGELTDDVLAEQRDVGDVGATRNSQGGGRSPAWVDGRGCSVGTGAGSLLLSGVFRQVYAAGNFRISVRQRLHAEV